jgi:3,4-dihydroxy 2-butanone 4-phosphate synthase/GTP cyclohydrolase II
MLTECFENLEIAHTVPALDATGQSPVSASIGEAIAELQAGRMIVVVDDEDRENEGDLVIAAEMITPDAVNFMATHARGLSGYYW